MDFPLDMVKPQDDRLYAIELVGLLRNIPNIPIREGGIEIKHRLIALDDPSGEQKRIYFELTPNGHIIPYADRLYAFPDQLSYGVQSSVGLVSEKMERRFRTIDNVIAESSEEDLAKGVAREFPDVAGCIDTNPFVNSGYMRRVWVQTVPGNNSHLAHYLFQLRGTNNVVDEMVEKKVTFPPLD